MPHFIKPSSSGGNPCLLVGAKVFMVGWLGRPGHNGTSIGIFDLHRKRWTWIFDPSPAAPYLNGGVVFLVDDVLYCHGGFTPDGGPSDKLFRLDLTLLIWEECEFHGIKPPGLAWQAGEYLEKHHSYVCFGGRSHHLNHIGAQGDVWVNEIDRHKWFKPTVTGRAPAVQGVTSCTVGEKIFFFGGTGSASIQDIDSDLYILESQSSRLRKVKWTTLNLGLKLSFSSLSYAHGVLLIFGGLDESLDPVKSLFACELPNYKVVDMSNQGARYNVRGSVENTYHHSAILHSGKMYVFDGYGRSFTPIRLRKL